MDTLFRTTDLVVPLTGDPDPELTRVLSELAFCRDRLAAAEARFDGYLRRLYVDGQASTDFIAAVVGISKNRVHERLTRLHRAEQDAGGPGFMRKGGRRPKPTAGEGTP